MRSYRMYEVDGKVEVEASEANKPEAGPGQLLVRIRAAGLNRGEFLPGHGQPGRGPAKACGNEAAGEVVGIGANVVGWSIGDRVMGRCPGAFSDFGLMDVREAIAVPLALDWQQAAAVPLAFMVVYDMIVAQGRLQAGETLLVAGVSSGVGVAALQAAKAMGAKVIGTSGSAEKLARLKTLGLDVGICTRRPDFLDAVMKATEGRGANLAINTVGGTVFPECVRALGFQGRLAMVGYVDGELKCELDLEALHTRRLTLFGVSNRLRSPAQRAESVTGFKADWLPLFTSGRMRPLVDRVYPFDALVEAKRSMESGEHVGKIVLTGSADA